MQEPRPFRELEAAIDAVAASYTGELEIDNLESAALPNEAEVVCGFEHLEPALFIGFYATRAVDRASLRYNVAEHLYAAFEHLAPQIERAQAYARSVGSAETPRSKATERDADALLLAFLHRLPAIRRMLEGDVQAAFSSDPSASSIEEVIFSYPSIRAMIAHRVAHELRKLGVPMIPRIISEYAHTCTGIDINPGATIGERFFLDHGTGVVIGETSVVGNDVKLYQQVTLGALSIPERDGDLVKQRHPTIEDEVTVYAGATILGGETVVGRGSTIGGNVWLIHSVPPGSNVFRNGR